MSNAPKTFEDNLLDVLIEKVKKHMKAEPKLKGSLDYRKDSNKKLFIEYRANYKVWQELLNKYEKQYKNLIADKKK